MLLTYRDRIDELLTLLNQQVREGNLAGALETMQTLEDEL